MNERTLKTGAAASGQLSVCLSLTLKHPDVWSHLLKTAQAFVSWRGDWVAHGNTWTSSTGCAIHLLPARPLRTLSLQELLDQFVLERSLVMMLISTVETQCWNNSKVKTLKGQRQEVEKEVTTLEGKNKPNTWKKEHCLSSKGLSTEYGEEPEAQVGP